MRPEKRTQPTQMPKTDSSAGKSTMTAPMTTTPTIAPDDPVTRATSPERGRGDRHDGPDGRREPLGRAGRRSLARAETAGRIHRCTSRAIGLA